jgi:antitoxin MazE
MPVRTRIVSIGNSRGIRIPKSLLEQSELGTEVEIRAEPGRLIVSSVRRPRAGWSEAAQRLRAEAGDRLLDAPVSTEFDRDEWQW